MHCVKKELKKKIQVVIFVPKMYNFLFINNNLWCYYYSYFLYRPLNYTPPVSQWNKPWRIDISNCILIIVNSLHILS